MDGKASTATQGVFGHWELAPEPLSSSLLPEPLSPSHPPLHSNNYLTTATLPPVFRTPLVQKEKGRRARKSKRGFGFMHLVQRGRMLITLGMKRAEKSQGVWGCHRAEAWVELPGDAAQTLSSGQTKSSCAAALPAAVSQTPPCFQSQHSQI